jgi:hypothetical protein
MKHFDHRALRRRDFLKGAGAVGLGSLAAGNLAANPLAGPILDTTGSVGFNASCILTPAADPGPNWRPVIMQRREITEGLPGMPLSVFFKAVRLSDCKPVSGLTLDFWQADHQGIYSAIPAQNTAGLTFLRGYQITPPNGIVRFDTIYPGWYPGRTTHLHVKVFQGLSVLFDTQLYLPEYVTRRVYETPLYAPFGQKDTANKDDAFFVPENVLPTRTMRTGTLGGATGVVPVRLYSGMTLVLDL